MSKLSIKLKIILCVASVLILLAFILPPVSQPNSFHHFADGRPWLGIANAGNVLSNLSFLFVGIYGMFFCFQAQRQANVKIAYLAVFIGLILTSLGSAYYHWQPDSNRLVWDRLPMTLVFMPLLVAVLSERIYFNLRIILPALLLTGIFTVVYWSYSGNLIPYFAAQYGSIFLLLLSTFLFPLKGDKWLYFACISYGAAMLCERLDLLIFQASGYIISGHTVKHILAALAFCFILNKLNYQRAALNSDRA
ncbi:MAG: ceramidase domain-containing protein [Filimonas sp.]|nr:ceramidase domain-containing protein [Filimonas sp.]